ncbi:MAG TPA: nucleotidyltransferase substrate binding protein [Candidatus Sulfotelmatobacter sp.]|nr:nucleotidyltransferase substrate binding protein [Candidatus Sulfotelmatobacter sp.]
MRSKLGNLTGQLKDALQRYLEVMRLEKNDIVRDSAIQRFEFTYELAWKTMKAYLEEKGLKELYSPKEVIRSAFQAGIISNDTTWLDMVETRNETSHIYNENMAEKVYAKLAAYLPLIEKLLQKLS